MMRFAPHVLLALSVGALVWWVTDLRGDNAALRADKLALRVERDGLLRSVEQAAIAADVHRAHIKRMTEAQSGFDAVLLDLQEMEGRDDPLSDLLRSTVNRLR